MGSDTVNKRILSMVLALVLILSILAGADIVGIGASKTSGSCGTKASYSYNSSTKTLTISGSGATNNYGLTSLKRAPWYDFKSELTAIVVEEGITEIGQLNFYNCTSLTSLSLPTSLKKIGGGTANYGAFRECTALTDLTFPEGLETIDDMAFRGCTALKTVTLPGTITTLGISVFQDCSNLETVNFGEGMTSTGVQTFRDSGLKYVNFSSTITTISAYTFFNTRIVTIEIPDNVTAIGTRSFADCTHLTTVTVHNPNTEFQGIIGEDPFNGSEQSITFYGHSGSTTQTYAETKNYKFLSLDDCEHESTHEVITVEPTCTEIGTSTQVCDTCGFTVSSSDIPATGHSYEIIDEVDKTDESKSDCDGHIYRTYECSVCHDIKEETEHVNYVEGYYDYTNTATCTRPGIETYTCNVESCQKTERHISPAGNHNVESWTVVSEPDCTKAGSQQGVCTICGETVTQEIPATQHDNILIDEFDNTEEDGHTYKIYKCSICEEQTVEATHVEWIEGFYDTETIIAPRCVIDGVGRDVCTVDGCNETRTVTLPANGQHDWYVTSTTEPTCTTAGATYYACNNCTLTKQERTSALGHDYVKDEENSVAPSCTADGYDFLKCSRCSSSQRNVIPATGHTPEEGTYTVVTEASCTSDGLATATCATCGEDYEIVLKALGHDYQDVMVEIDGKPGHAMKTPTCSRCGRTESAELVHNEWIEGYYSTRVITEGTCVVARVTRDTCSICGETRTNTIAAPGHDYSYTGLDDGGNLTYTCSRCNNVATRTPDTVMALWRTSYINHNPSEFTLGYLLNLDNNSYINAKDYALLKRAYNAKKQEDESTTDSSTSDTTKGHDTPIIPIGQF